MVTTGKGRSTAIGDLSIAIFRVNAHLLETGNSMVKDIGITSAWWQVLGAMDSAGTAISVSEIARVMGLVRQSVQRIVDVMATRGFVSFEDNPSHRRAKLVVFTDKGREAFEAARSRQVPWANGLLEALGTKRVTAAVALLEELDELLADALEGQS